MKLEDLWYTIYENCEITNSQSFSYVKKKFLYNYYYIITKFSNKIWVYMTNLCTLNLLIQFTLSEIILPE